MHVFTDVMRLLVHECVCMWANVSVHVDSGPCPVASWPSG